MLPVSLDCPFLIAPSMFSNVYIMYYDVSRNTTFYRYMNGRFLINYLD
jgi:hypothetical protein